MKILKLHSRQFPNALHVQCMIEIGDWAPMYPDLLAKIQGLINPFLLWLTREKTAYQFVIRSIITAEKEGKDRERDDGFHGLYYTTLAATRYYDPAVVAAAKRLLLVLGDANRSSSCRTTPKLLPSTPFCWSWANTLPTLQPSAYKTGWTV
jgi:hypothetical protein